ncbi:Lrp/AsnC family transcriptional regulator [Pseudonocardia sp. GCM10023141]|uniref:Lrp/AsnC family transcriptional regulator n=1 Tax=Pseudonocardia sp. GCM10023141 TaxID=3252653 RepID=UPI0036222657
MDDTDRLLLSHLQEDATQSYATLGAAVGLSTAATHERVRKLRERGVIRRTTIDVDPAAAGRGVLAFVMIEADAWIGGQETGAALRALPWVEEAHIVAGGPSVLAKIRTATTADLQGVLKAIYDIDGVTGTGTIVVLDTFFERPLDVSAMPSGAGRG